MSFSCELEDCKKVAEWECACESKVHLCMQHLKTHVRVCKQNPTSVEDVIAGQRIQVVEAGNWLKGLRSKVLENEESMMLVIHQAYTTLSSSLDSNESLLNEMKFGAMWDAKLIASIKGLGLKDFNLESLMQKVFETLQFKELGIISEFNQAISKKLIKQDQPSYEENEKQAGEIIDLECGCGTKGTLDTFMIKCHHICNECLFNNLRNGRIKCPQCNDKIKESDTEGLYPWDLKPSSNKKKINLHKISRKKCVRCVCCGEKFPKISRLDLAKNCECDICEHCQYNYSVDACAVCGTKFTEDLELWLMDKRSTEAEQSNPRLDCSICT